LRDTAAARMLCAMLVLHILACTTISLSQAYDASIDVTEDSVTVEVRSSAAVSAEGARLMLRREQTVHWRSSLTRVDTVAGLVHVAGASPLRYVITGDTKRIPLPVPIVPMVQDRRTARIVVTGLSSTTPVHRAFPRFVWARDTAVAEVRDVPSFVRIPEGAGWGVGRWSDAFVVVLVVVTSGLWYRRQRIAR
jgi:hypothetical protein